MIAPIIAGALISGAASIGSAYMASRNKGGGTSSESSNSHSYWKPDPDANQWYWYGNNAGEKLNELDASNPYYSSYLDPNQRLKDSWGLTDRASQGMVDANSYYQGAAGLGGQSSPYYQDAAGRASQQGRLFDQASQQQLSANPYYNSGADTFGYGSQMLAGAAGQQAGVAGASGQNYNFLSNAADVANNPFVQAQIEANERSVMDTLTQKMLPATTSGAVSVNAMGTSRHGLAEGTAMSESAKALANQNASTMLDAYGQGLSAQQYALGQTGSMQDAYATPGRTMMESAQGYINAGNARELGASSYAQAGRYGLEGADASSRAGGYMMDAARGQEYGGNMLQGGARGINEGASWMNQSGTQEQEYMGMKRDDENARQRAEYDAYLRRLALAERMQAMYQPLGQNYTYGNGTQTAPRQDTTGNMIAGAINGGMAGYGIYDQWNRSRTPQATSQQSNPGGYGAPVPGYSRGNWS